MTSTMTVRLPGAALAGAGGGPAGPAAWQRELDLLVGSLAQGLAGKRLPAVRVQECAGETATVEIGGRPLAVGLDVTGSGFAEAMTERLIRRPGLLCDRPGVPASAAERFADLGFRPGRAGPPGDAAHPAAPDRVEEAIDAVRSDEIVLEGPATVLRRMNGDERGLVPALRRQVLADRGVRLPDIRLVPAATSDPVLRIRVHDLVVSAALPGGARWSDVVDCLARTIRPRLHWFLRQRDVGAALDDLGYLVPDLVQSGTDRYRLGTLTATLREVLRHGGSIRNVARLIWLLLDLGGSTPGPDRLALAESPRRPLSDRPGGAPDETDPAVLAALLRKARTEEAWRIGTLRLPARIGRLSAATEEALSARPAPAAAEWAVLDEIRQLGMPELVVTRSAGAVPAVAWCLQALPRPPRVVASHELPPDADVAGLPVARPAPTQGATT